MNTKPWKKSWPYIALFLGGVFSTCLLLYPGYMAGWDQTWVLNQGRTHQYEDWHSPMLGFVWGLLDIIIPGAGGLFLWNTCLFWLGVVILLSLFTKTLRARILWLIFIAFNPLTLCILSQTFKDTSISVAMFFLTAVNLKFLRTKNIWVLWGSILIQFYMLGLRQNAAPLVGFFCLWSAYLCGEVYSRKSVTYGIRVITGSWLLLLLYMGIFTFNYAILGAKKNHLTQVLYGFDLVGISVESKRDYFPLAYVPPNSGITKKEMAEMYTPKNVGTLYWGMGSKKQLPLFWVGNELVVQLLHTQWLDAIKKEPFAYLRHRSKNFLTQLGLIDPGPATWGPFIFPFYEIEQGKEWNHSWRLWFFHRLLMFWRKGPVFTAWPYILFLLFSIPLLWRSPNPLTKELLFPVGGALAYFACFFFVGLGNEFFYAYPVALACLPVFVALSKEVFEMKTFTSYIRSISFIRNSNI